MRIYLYVDMGDCVRPKELKWSLNISRPQAGFICFNSPSGFILTEENI